MPKPVYVVKVTYFKDDYKCRGDWSSTDVKLFHKEKYAKKYARSIVIEELKEYKKEDKIDEMPWGLMVENIDEWFQGEFVPRRLGIEIHKTEIE